MAPTNDDLELALRLADAADVITLDRFGALDLQVTSKPDLTPVTDADQGVERAIREMLAIERPDDAVLGEEYGVTGDAVRRWVIDPIDGTKNFVRGVPVWSTLIALMDESGVAVGVISAPSLNRRWFAVRGGGSWAIATGQSADEARQLHVSQVASLDDASLGYSDFDGWEFHKGREPFIALMDAVWRTRAYGDFWTYCMIAEGSLDVGVEPIVTLWDLAPLALLVTEAGGRFTGVNGLDGPQHGSAVASNGLLHDAVLSALGPAGF
jgi:histidinol-phosphatase